MDEIIFEVREDEVDGGFVATALGHAIATQGETLEELRGNGPRRGALPFRRRSAGPDDEDYPPPLRP